MLFSLHRLALVAFAISLLLPLSVNASRKPPTFIFDYAKAPASRWGGALELAIRGKSWNETFGPIFGYHNQSLFDKVTPEMYTRITEALYTNFPEQAEELEGIAQQFQQIFPDQYVSYEYLATWIYYHEIAHAEFENVVDDNGDNIDAKDKNKRSKQNEKLCTGLLAADSSGRVHHVANMDQSPPNVREVTLHVKYIDSNLDIDDELLFQGVDWYWFNTGTTRMVMKGVASCQENWRHAVERIPIEEVLQDIDDGVQSHVLVFRLAFENIVRNDPSIGFEGLLEQMSTIRLAAPEYIVMAGPHKMQGAVLARNQTGVATPDGRVLRLGESDGNPTSAKNAPDITTWALAQTNYDHWKEDDPRDPRRTVAEQTLENFGQEMAATYVGLYAVASTYPVHATSTAYTAVMNAKTGELQPFVRAMMCPVGDADCLENAEAHGLGFGAGNSAGTDKKHLRVGTTGDGSHVTLYGIIIGVLGAALLVVFGLLIKTKSDVRSQYRAVPNATKNGLH